MFLVVKRRAVFFAAVLLLSEQAHAQSISITSPSAPVTVPEGEDFAAKELQNPWDLNEKRDIGWEQGYQEPNVSGGIWRGVNAAQGAYFFPLFPGFKGALQAEGLPGDRQLPRLGINHPITASKYRLLSMRMRVSQPSSYAVYWSSDPNAVQYWPTGSQFGARFDGEYPAGSAPLPHTGYVFRMHDMSTLAGFEAKAGSWAGNIIALRIDPSQSAGAGQTTELDWVRLSDPNSAPVLPISWTGSGLSPSRVVILYVDTVPSGYNGTPVAYLDSRTPQSSTYQFPTAALPPGDYYFYLAAYSLPGMRLQTRSGYSARLRVTNAPIAYFTAPTQISGEDYAASRAINPWDMSDAGDIANLPGSPWPDGNRQYSNQSFQNGVFQATANPPLPVNRESDVQVYLNVPPARPIETGRFRYLTYRIAADSTQFPTLPYRIEHGWVTRTVYWNQNLGTDGGSTSAHLLYEGWNTYTYDLQTAIFDAGRPWSANSFFAHLRIDPLEINLPIYTWFFLDWVKLTAENRATNGIYTTTWTIEDTDSGTFSASLYADRDRNGTNRTLLRSFSSISGRNHGFNWDTRSLPSNQSYYLFLVVSDGTNTRSYYSSVPVLTGQAAAPLRALPKSDYDGDGKSDQVIFRPSNGSFYVRRSSAGPTAVAWGAAGHIPIVGDFDGDGRADIATVVSTGGRGAYLDWSILRSSDSQLYRRQWGVPGDFNASGDYDGDGLTEIAVFRQGIWWVLDEGGAATAAPWGEPGDLPATGDYDGDGRSDLAIWRPTTGTWWIINSGFASGASQQYAVIQWGLPGDIPMPADYDGDGRTDPAVWRPQNGTWYLRPISGAAVQIVQWGLPGDSPFVGDFNGDGRIDLSVVRPGETNWYHNFRNGSTAVVQWGLPGDLLPIGND